MIKSHPSTDAYLERKDTMKLKQFSVAVPVTLIVLGGGVVYAGQTINGMLATHRRPLPPRLSFISR